MAFQVLKVDVLARRVEEEGYEYGYGSVQDYMAAIRHTNSRVPFDEFVVKPNPNLGLEVKDGVLSGNIKFTCAGSQTQCATVLDKFNNINNHDNVNIDFSIIGDKSLSTFDVIIEALDPSKNGQSHGERDHRNNTITILSTHINGITPLHELGHMLGAPHRGEASRVSRMVATRQSIMLSGYSKYSAERINNFDNTEINEFIRAYSDGGG